MKQFWFKMNRWNREIATSAIESGFQTFYLPSNCIDKMKELAKVVIIANSEKADLQLGKDVLEITINTKADEKKVTSLHGKIPVILDYIDWTIIPLENLISKTTNLIQLVHSQDEVKTSLTTLERGADGILLEIEDKNTIKKVGELITKSQNEKLKLQEAEIIETASIGMGDRVIIDTATILKPGQGLLIGDSSSIMFLVYNENVINPYCEPRPFRVNAGGVHAYIRMPGNQTMYISELKSGMITLLVDPRGNTEEAIIGMVKIEKRPMMLIRARMADKEFTLVMQNEETIRLTKPSGEFISIVKLKHGDKVLANVQETAMGRHFGQAIKEIIIEK